MQAASSVARRERPCFFFTDENFQLLKKFLISKMVESTQKLQKTQTM